jgi:hydroxyacylglutathione hydrolase
MLQVKVFTFNPMQENTYVVYNEQKLAAIIDPGCYFEDEKDELQSFIQENGLNPVLLLNTHCHLDHVFGCKFVSKTWNLTLHIHNLEIPVLQMAPASGLMFNVPFDNYVGDTKFLEEGDVVKLGEDELSVILTPGHSPGSICFYSEKQKFMISGDVLFYSSIGRTDLPGGNHNQLLRSIREKLFTLPKDVVVHPGHGDSTTIEREMKYNPFLV